MGRVDMAEKSEAREGCRDSQPDAGSTGGARILLRGLFQFDQQSPQLEEAS